METVKSLRQKGYKVHVHHWRPINKKTGLPKERGGETHLVIYEGASFNKITEGVARCHTKDHYCKKDGVALALFRALEAAPEGSIQ